MLKSGEFRILTAIGVIALLASLANIGLVRSNRALQADANGRGQLIQQSVQLQALYQDIVKAIADLSVRNKDEALRDVLTQEGITVSINPPTDGTGAPAAKGKP